MLIFYSNLPSTSRRDMFPLSLTFNDCFIEKASFLATQNTTSLPPSLAMIDINTNMAEWWEYCLLPGYHLGYLAPELLIFADELFINISGKIPLQSTLLPCKKATASLASPGPAYRHADLLHISTPQQSWDISFIQNERIRWVTIWYWFIFIGKNYTHHFEYVL